MTKGMFFLKAKFDVGLVRPEWISEARWGAMWSQFWLQKGEIYAIR